MGGIRKAFIEDESLVDVRKVVFREKGRDVKVNIDNAALNICPQRTITGRQFTNRSVQVIGVQREADLINCATLFLAK